MALYNPPKGNNWGSVLQMAGTTASSAGGILSMTGAGAPIGLAAGVAGSLISGVGSLISGNQEVKRQRYEQTYQARVRGEENLNASINNIRQLAQK